MSIKVMGEVWESSSAKGGTRLVLLALADHANDEGYCHPSVARLARKSALTERNVQLILRNLETRGELVTVRSAGRGNVNAYWVLPPATVARLTLEGKNAKNFHPVQTLEEKVKSTTEKVKPTSPRTVKNHQEPPQGSRLKAEGKLRSRQSQTPGSHRKFTRPRTPTGRRWEPPTGLQTVAPATLGLRGSLRTHHRTGLSLNPGRDGCVISKNARFV